MTVSAKFALTKLNDKFVKINPKVYETAVKFTNALESESTGLILAENEDEDGRDRDRDRGDGVFFAARE